MSHRMLLAALFVAVLATPVSAGPPWISVELPANPHHASTRGASLMLRAYHHSTAIAAPISGVAEGIVDGRRTTLPLDVRPASERGLYAVHTPLPKGGTWVLAFTLRQSEEATATALVTVDGRGRIVDVDVPSNRTRDGWMVPRRVDRSDIEAALRAADVAYGERADDARLRLALVLPLLLIGGAVALRRRS